MRSLSAWHNDLSEMVLEDTLIDRYPEFPTVLLDVVEAESLFRSGRAGKMHTVGPGGRSAGLSSSCCVCGTWTWSAEGARSVAMRIVLHERREHLRDSSLYATLWK